MVSLFKCKLSSIRVRIKLNRMIPSARDKRSSIFGQYIFTSQAKRAQNFSIALNFEGESRDHQSFLKLKNLTFAWSLNSSLDAI